jgi:hypothetical protein
MDTKTDKKQLPEPIKLKRSPTDWTSIAVTMDTHDYIDSNGLKLNKQEYGKRLESHNDTLRRLLDLKPQVTVKSPKEK